MRPALGLRLFLAFSLSPLLVFPVNAQINNSSPDVSVEEQLDTLRHFRLDISEGRTQTSYLDAHHTLLGIY